jgi:hypothetical protein
VALGSGASEGGPGVGRSERRTRLLLGAVVAGLVGVALATDLPAVSQRSFWGDGATYYAMAWSLAKDLDVRFEGRDLARVRREYPEGPQGLFLKRASGGLTASDTFPWVRRIGADEKRLYYAKALAYPLVAAPFVSVFGTRGLLVTNALLLGLALWVGYGALRRRGLAPAGALATALVFFLGTVVPLYLFWPTPEVFGLALVAAGLAAWAAGRPLLAAALFGVAGYVKPPNLLMAAPLGLEPLVDGWRQTRLSGLGRGLLECLRRGIVMVLVTACGYGLNAAATGELNYQGGERKTFYDRFPGDETGATFDNTGFWMTTPADHVGPLVGGRDEGRVSSRTGPARDPSEIPESFAWNLLYFWVGRFGGVLAYFFPAVVALLLFMVLGPRQRAGWLALVAVGLSWVAYIWVIPDNWYGGGGTVGNRYFLNVLPAFLFVVPPLRTRSFVAVGLLGSLTFLAPVLASPVYHSLKPGDHATRGPFRLLPAELTMLNDLSVFTEPWRKKRPFGFAGNAERHADPDAYNLYFLDDGTYGKEVFGGRTGFWLRAGKRAELVVRAFDLAPVDRIVVRVTGGPMGDIVSVRQGGTRHRLAVGPGQTREVALPVGRGLRYYDTYLHVLHLSSRRGAPLPDGRAVGAFVEIRLEMGPPFPSREDP